jgi:hypothetical protein
VHESWDEITTKVTVKGAEGPVKVSLELDGHAVSGVAPV